MAWSPDPVVEAALEKKTISAALLVFMDFVDAPKRWWPEFGTLHAGGYEWQGTGDLVAVDGLEVGGNMESTQTTFTLSGLNPELVALGASSIERVKERRVTVYLQFFHVEGEERAIMENLGEPFVAWSGIMDSPRFTGDADKATITIPAENIWVNRNRPPFGLYTYKDQIARFPGDRSLKAIQGLVKKTIRGFPS